MLEVVLNFVKDFLPFPVFSLVFIKIYNFYRASIYIKNKEVESFDLGMFTEKVVFKRRDIEVRNSNRGKKVKVKKP